MSIKVIVIGAGASGLMCGGVCAESGAEVTIIEKNDKPARKVMITGKGRCNVTNNCTMLNELIANVPTNGRFLYSSFTRFMPSDTIDFFEDMGVPLKVERGNRVFPVSDKATDIVDALNMFAQTSGAKRIQGRVTDLIIENGEVKGVKTLEGNTYFADRVVIATGGKSYSATGSTGDGYALAKAAGHTITEIRPSLCPVVCHENWCTSCQGLTLKNCSIVVREKESYKEVYKDFGEMLFTHFGVTGPMILSASAHMRELGTKKYEIYIDMKPALTYEQLDKRIQNDFQEFSNKNLINSLGKLLPRLMIPVVVRLSGIKPTTKTNQVTKEQRSDLCNVFKQLKLTAVDFRPIDEAIITSGGVCVDEINPKTMESKLVKGLYFAGEVIDVDAYTGGFNLQIAFSTGRCAGENAGIE